MKFYTIKSGLVIFVNIGLVISIGSSEENSDFSWLFRRALANAPNGYIPTNVSCPSSRPSVRSAARLSPDELSWLEKRRNNTIEPLKALLNQNSIANFDAVSYIGQIASNLTALPNIGVAVSGGGYRAMLNGAGALKAFDSRTNNSTSPGHLGGLLQSATYVAGLSGGGWLLGSIYINNFTSVSALQTDPGVVWDLKGSILEGPAKRGIQTLGTLEYYQTVYDAVQSKKKAGYDTSITDYWGRMLSFQFINATQGGINYTWSSIASMSDFQAGNMPLPLLIADGRNPGEKIIGANSTLFEFNPWEFGTFDPTVFGFVPLEYLGSPFEAGAIPDSNNCVRGFDNAGYVIGTSSSLFNQFLLRLNSTKLSNVVKSIASEILTALDETDNDIASYTPNPFFQYNNNLSPFAQFTALNVVDGGEDGQNIPLHPLIQPTRNVDVIFAIDSTSNIHNWPSGKSLVTTYERSLNSSGIGNGTAFPSIPDANTFVNLGLNSRPTFFGCNSSNMTGPSPIIVYLPNYPYITFSNVSTFDMAYNNTQRDAIILNGYNVVTMGNGTRDSAWPTCVSCAILSRSLERTGTAIPDACTECFQTYCWDGTLNSTAPADYAPSFFLAPISLTSLSVGLYVPSKLSVVVITAIAAFMNVIN